MLATYFFLSLFFVLRVVFGHIAAVDRLAILNHFNLVNGPTIAIDCFELLILRQQPHIFVTIRGKSTHTQSTHEISSPFPTNKLRMRQEKETKTNQTNNNNKRYAVYTPCAMKL